MAVSVSIWLFSRAEVEVVDGSPKALRKLGRQLQDRLNQAADLVGKLCTAGWHYDLVLDEIEFTAPLDTKAEVEAQLRALDIDPNKVHLNEWSDEEALV